jgi:hypothetical protein
MGNVFADSLETYREHAGLVLLFSIPFVIAALIPVFASVPTYVSSGAIFLRSASVFLNLNMVEVGVIIVAMFLSLLFLSFAAVAITLIVKTKRTHTGISGSVVRDLEKYTGRVFAVLLIYSAVLAVVEILSFPLGLQGILTPLVGFFLFVPVFYAPAAVVLENKNVFSAMKQSAHLVVKEPQYFILWTVAIALVITALEFVTIPLTGTYSDYVVLAINSLLLLPYFVICLAESYMRRFSLLKH